MRYTEQQRKEIVKIFKQYEKIGSTISFVAAYHLSLSVNLQDFDQKNPHKGAYAGFLTCDFESDLYTFKKYFLTREQLYEALEDEKSEWQVLASPYSCITYGQLVTEYKTNNLYDLFQETIWNSRDGSNDCLIKIKNYLNSIKNDMSEELEDFFYDIDNSKSLKLYSDVSIDNFFRDHTGIVQIMTVDTKEVICEIVAENTSYTFIVNLNTKYGENYSVKTIIKSKKHLNRLILSTIESLKLYDEFVQFAEYLEEIVN